ncbi:hypothetical protein B0A49_13065 [Cryomyces minteri]|uniref:HAT C-terminal dimerisation domain-containing protein n=1 Tax=Cryomyces minteri TaxID=331657 RepID=A0A4U0VYK9_9PEZI|nr:hypothetical protein B0A49_13065 [Cryomyces minteri]
MAPKHPLDDDEATSMISSLESPLFDDFKASTPSSTTSATSSVKKQRTSASKTWEEAREPHGEEPLRNAFKQRYWYCKHCIIHPFRSHNTQGARIHLASKHQVHITEDVDKTKADTQARLESTLDKQKEKKAVRMKETADRTLFEAVDRAAFNEALCQLICLRNLPFNCVEWPELRALLITVNYAADDVFCDSHTTVSHLLLRSFTAHRSVIAQKLYHALSKIHFTVDAWTAPNHTAYQAIVAHFVDESGSLQKALLALPEHRGRHGGEEQAAAFMEVIKAYNITHKLGYVTGDNHGSNDKMCRLVSAALLELDEPRKWDPVQHRIRCHGHVVNLASQAFLFARDPEAIDIPIAEAEADESNSTPADENLAKRLKKAEATNWRNQATLDLTLKSMDFLIKHYERSKSKHAGNLDLSSSIITSWLVFDKYYNLTDATPAYAAALLLHPSRREQYLIGYWKREWQEAAIEAVKKLWETQYKDRVLTHTTTLSTTGVEPDEYDLFEAQLQRDLESSAVKDELQRFIKADPIKIVTTALSWWLHPERREAFPNLSCMAIDILSIPAMSAEAERIFSGARRTISWERARLGAANVERTECLKSWIRNGLVSIDNPDDVLSADDWHELTELLALLKPLKMESKHVQSDPYDCQHGTLHEALTSIDFLMSKLESFKEQHKHLPSSHLKACINLGWKKLNKYYLLSDQTSAYRAAIVLHPHYKMGWFYKHWSDLHKDWIGQAKEAVEELYKDYCRRHSDEVQAPAKPTKELDGFTRYNTLDDDDDGLDELERHMAFDLLATPASSAADERQFSKAGHVLNEERFNTLDDLAEAYQCLKSWYEQDLVDEIDTGGSEPNALATPLPTVEID